MKVKCIKDTIGFNKGEIYPVFGDKVIFTHGLYDNINLLVAKYPEYFQEVKEEKTKNPRWRVGDYVVNELVEPLYLKITGIQYPKRKNGEYAGFWQYSISSRNVWFTEDELRDPTESELKLYFR